MNAAAWATSPGFESNDLGFNPRSDRWGGHVAVELRKPEPDGFTRFRALTVAKSYAYNFDGDKQGDAVNVFGRLRPPQLLERGRERLVPLARPSTTGRRAAGRP